MVFRTIFIKPLSVNQAWQGRRFKSPKYKEFESRVLGLLPTDVEIPEGKLTITLKWGVSSPLFDWDNPIKPFQDILQKKYDFNDNRVFRAIIDKELVKRGEEYISFNIEKWKKN